MVLGTAFSDQVDVLGADISFSVSGTFTPRVVPARTLPTGVAVPCRLTLARTDPRVPVGKPGVRSPGWLVILNHREVPDAPREGDEIRISEGPFTGTYFVTTIQEAKFARHWRVSVRTAA